MNPSPRNPASAQPGCRVCASSDGNSLCLLSSWDSGMRPLEATIRTYQPRQVIFQEGSPANAVYCLREGIIKLWKVGDTGEELIIRILGPGSLLGYRPVLVGEPYAATAESIVATTLCCIGGDSFMEVLRSSAQASFSLLVRLARELRVSEDQMLSIAQQSVRQRVVRLLCAFLDAAEPAAGTGGPVPIPLMRSEMAQMIGTTPETLSRTLRQLANESVIRLTRTELFVEDAPTLLRMLSGSPLRFDPGQDSTRRPGCSREARDPSASN
jgi:CRP/FNR family transcriptional regulator, polysaccharide utilization system transcription regulator